MPYLGFMVSSKTTVLTVRLPNELAAAIRKVAEQYNQTPSQMMAQMLREGVDRYDLKPEGKRK